MYNYVITSVVLLRFLCLIFPKLWNIVCLKSMIHFDFRPTLIKNGDSLYKLNILKPDKKHQSINH